MVSYKLYLYVLILMKSQGKISFTLIKRFMHLHFESASVKTQVI